LRDQDGRCGAAGRKKYPPFERSSLVRAFGTAFLCAFGLELGVPKPSGEAKREKTQTEGEIFREANGISGRIFNVWAAKVRLFGEQRPPVWPGAVSDDPGLGRLATHFPMVRIFGRLKIYAPFRKKPGNRRQR
jgi:hypothetical protein